MKYILYLDSLQSTGARASASVFHLNQQILNAMQVKVLAFTFGNTLHNIVASSNTLIFDTVTVTVPPANYTFAELLTYLNTTLMANVAFAAKMVALQALQLDTENNVLWTIGLNILQGGTLLSVFGITETKTGSFQSFLYLARPSSIAISCNAFHGGNDRFVTTKDNSIQNVFYVGQIQSGFGEEEPPNYDYQFTTQLSRSNLSQIELSIFNPCDSRELTELTHFSLTLELLTL